MTSSPTEDWTHTAVVLVLPAEEATRHIIGSIQDAVDEVLASPEFDEVSVHLVLSTPGKHISTSPSLDAVLLKVITETDAKTISLVWCTDKGVADIPLTRDLDALHAVQVDFPTLGTLEHASTNVPTAIRDIVIRALDAAEDTAGAPRDSIEAAVTGFRKPTQRSQEPPANAESFRGRERTRTSVQGAPDLSSPVALTANAGYSLQLSGPEAFNTPSAGDAQTEQAKFAVGWPDPDMGDHAADESGSLTSNLHGVQTGNPTDDDNFMGSTADSFQPLSHYAEPGATALSDLSSPLHHGYGAADKAVFSGPPASPYPQADSASPTWIPPVVQNVVSSVTSQVDQWRARRTKVRRAEEQIGVSALERLPVHQGSQRPLIYFALAASMGWDKQAVRTRDAALTLLSDALDRHWIAVALNLGSALTRVAGPDSPKSVTHDWRRIERNNDFDLGDAAAELSMQFDRDNASLRLRGHEVDPPHVVIFATEPPYVDSVASSAYLALLRDVQSVTWLLVGDSHWMEFPPELDDRPSRVLYAEQDGVAILLSKVLASPEIIPPGQIDM
ncbi:hypothetical protein QF031_003019 [Pseudarthrobacter defluvii]|uniref:hypothetical protein n=1 Tax=Pseudarthrobacter defluvii TaxID=410837 RepID=UPI00278158AC|nr:hypothetical protein [Pseudarthrobacter defluvii]MDQ0770270.1 hypothetical protein [Pseudarthrobacter defluvii]